VRSPDDVAHQVVLLALQGMGVRAIARALHVGKKRVRKLLRQHRARRDAATPLTALPPLPPPRPSMLDEHGPFVRDLLDRYPDITAQRVFEELRARRDFDGGYTIVKGLVRKLRPRPVVEPSNTVEEPEPGQLAECDWAQVLVPFKRGGPRKIQLFGYTLASSHRRFFRRYDRSDLHALLDGHVQAFAYLEGLAHTCKYDGQKAVVLRWEGQQPIFNLRFVDFATYYEYGLIACRPGHPDDKPHVELSYRGFRRSFMNGRSFEDEADFDAQLLDWMVHIEDERPQRRKQRRTPSELFAEEQPHLLPLPRHPYDTARVVYRVCDLEGFVAWEGNRYSLPVDHVTEILPVRITQQEIFVYAQDLRLVARHPLRRRGGGEDVVAPGHRPRRTERGPGLDQLRLAYRHLGDGGEGFLAALERAQPRSAAYHARCILALRERYGTADVAAALDHALRYAALDHRAVERILQARAQPRRLDEYIAEETAQRLAQAVGQSRTEPRDLSVYDTLPNWAQARGETRCPPSDDDPKADEAETTTSSASCANTSSGSASASSTGTSSST
jgi:transposase